MPGGNSEALSRDPEFELKHLNKTLMTDHKPWVSFALNVTCKCPDYLPTIQKPFTIFCTQAGFGTRG